MSEYYRGKRKSNIYDPAEAKPFKVSRSKIDLFLECPRCFYLDRRLGVGRPPGFPFALNSAVDSLLKNEFDLLRAKGKTHPLIKQFKIDARPAPHAMIDEWRENFKGVQFYHEPTNLVITGAIDDLWIDSLGNYMVVDYKSTAKDQPVTALGDASYHDSYRMQMEVYQWLLRNNGLSVSNTGYFVYCTGRNTGERFDARIDFDIHIFPYVGKADWVEPTLKKLKEVLDSDIVPKQSDDCDYCRYTTLRNIELAE